MKIKLKSKILSGLLIICMFTALLFIVAIPALAAGNNDVNYTGYHPNLSAEALHAISNVEKRTDGTYNLPVMSGTPSITFLIPGLKSNASTWSNDYTIS